MKQMLLYTTQLKFNSFVNSKSSSSSSLRGGGIPATGQHATPIVLRVTFSAICWANFGLVTHVLYLHRNRMIVAYFRYRRIKDTHQLDNAFTELTNQTDILQIILAKNRRGEVVSQIFSSIATAHTVSSWTNTTVSDIPAIPFSPSPFAYTPVRIDESTTKRLLVSWTHDSLQLSWPNLTSVAPMRELE